MRTISELERAEIQAITDDFAKNFTKRKKADESSETNFSEARPAEFDFDEHNKAAKAHFGLSDIKNIVARYNVKDSIRQYILQRNSVIAANKAKAKEREAQKKDKFVSHPNWY